MFKGLSISSPTAKFTPYEWDPGALGKDQVDIKVEYCGICHSDLSMKENEWKQTRYPFVPGHEVVGTVAAIGESVTNLKVGERVGLGWFSASCLTCPQCLSGSHNLCPHNEQTIVGRKGGFANFIRAQHVWVLPLPKGLPPESSGPLFCGGITVFNPLIQFDVKPLDKVGVIGIGGLGHLALQFLKAWGCEVVAFTSSPSKADEAKKLGASRVVDTKSEAELVTLSRSLNFILSTATADYDWQKYLSCLAPKGRLHFVGVPSGSLALSAFPLILSQLSVSGSPLGSPYNTARMLEFCERHKIRPVAEFFQMSKADEAFEHLKAGKARYRVILKCDL